MSVIFTRLLFKMMPRVAGMTSYSDQLLMYDNLDTPLSETYTDEVREFLKMLPVKVNFTVVILCIEGSVEMSCNLKNLIIRRNGLLVIPPGTKAESLEIRPSSRVVVMVVPNPDFAPPSSFQNSIYATSNFTSPTVIELEDHEVRQSVSVYRMLKEQLTGEQKAVNSDLVKAYILLMAGVAAVAFQRWKMRNNKVKQSSKELIYAEFLTRLAEDFHEHRDVAYYANAAGLTPKYFASVIYDASASHPLDLIREQVVLEAQRMLKNGAGITEVCKALNFSSQSQFTNYFKAAVGMPPGEFVKSVEP